MSQAIVDPAELRKFAQQLKHFNSELVAQMSGLQRQMGALGSTWRDQEHQKFLAEFEQQMKHLARFVEAGDQYAPFLLRKAERIDAYLHQR